MLNKYYDLEKRISWHIAFWICFLLYHVFIIGSFEENYLEVFTSRALNLPVKIGTTYFVLYALIPRFFMAKKLKAFVALFLVTLLFAGFLQHLYYYFVIDPVLYPERVQARLTFPYLEILKNVLSTYPVVALAAFIKIGKDWLEKDRNSQKLEKEKVEAELKFLRAQMHPHFLFNTLNNLYALTLKKSDKAPEVVLKLSNLLDYILYEANAHKVPLEKELELVETYIHLEKIRYGDKLRVDYRVKGGITGRSVPPLIILPFVENSFKHGVSQQLKEKYIKIQLEVKGEKMILEIENSKSNENEKQSVPVNNGIGLKNVKRRLELLYGKDHELIITNEEHFFHILMSINLN